MSALTFDTHLAIKNLIRSGVPEEQAEAITETVKQAQDAHLEQLSTKADMMRLEGEVKQNRWMIAATFAGVVALLLKAFFGIG